MTEARDRAHRLGTHRLPPPVGLAPADALGAVLAEALRARSDVPAADASAMDGFAVSGPGPWQVRGRVLAGGAPAAALQPGDAVEVATGALVPAGCERVLPVEVVDVAAGVLRLVGDEPGRRHVRPRGEECVQGEELLPAGRRVTASVAGLAAGTGTDVLQVRRPPRVHALVTGDEIVTSGLPVPGQVRDAVGPLLPDAVRTLGGTLSASERCGDAVGELDAALETMLASDADVLLTCGMAGAGPADRLRPWLAQVGARLVVDGVAVRPGHPQVLAQLPDGRPLVGLPGNPLAAVAALLVLLRPLLAGMTGAEPGPPPHALLTGWQPRGRPVTSLVPVRHAGPGRVEPSGPAGPAQLRGLAAADAVALVPPGWDPSTPVELLPRP
ncbi:molybdopterin molybdotransferase MoeA [Jannaschia sp. R86511]|uniref:molybdopterin molybdotransferase MoeA n=1 Tax=Jannaschia sp. R86511 TaxID=3093853 RepID=UPI0036D2B36D